MSIIFFLLLACSGEIKIDLKDAGIYNMESNAVHKTKNLFVFSSSTDHALILFNKTKIEKIYKKPGKGPFELDYPIILGVKNDLIYTYTNRGHVLVFDSDLSVVKKQISKITNLIFAAKPTSCFIDNKNEFMTASMQSRVLLNKSTINGNGTVVTENHFRSSDIFRKGFGVINNGHIFITEEYFPNDSYHIKVFNIDPDFTKTMVSQIQMELTHSVSSFPQDKWPLPDKTSVPGRAFIAEMVKLEKGYLIALSRCKILGDLGGEYIRYWDFFDDTGKFLKREQVKDSRYLVPVVNSYDLFVFDEDEEVLIPFKL